MQRYQSFKDRMRQRQIANIQARSTEVDRKPVVEYMLEHRGLKVILTNHCKEQFRKRRDMSIERQKAWFIRAIDGLAEQNWTPDFENHEIFIYNKSMKQGMVVAFRRDFKAESSKVCFVVVTAYPKGRRKGAQSDTEVIYV
jgi:hypothetical protein